MKLAGYLFVCSYLTSVLSVTIRTPQGQVDGKIEKIGEYGEVTKFLGIPYAQPPVSGLRFEPPQKADDFREIYDATYGRPLCPQPETYLGLLNLSRDSDVHFRTDEDCLYLNVYIPGAVLPGRNLPVMVWFHGGGWQWGSGTHYDGRKLAAIGKVIVVTLNYRLGILGFLPDGTRASTLGLQDQIEALKWVRLNIWSYGGDPGMVTIFGESAGGSSVSFLCSSPAAKGLFHRAISQSGLKNSAWAFDEDRRLDKMQAIAMKIRRNGCNRKLLDCLQNAPVSELVSLTQFVMSSLALSGWTPHADGHVVMADVLENNTFTNSRIERMIGFNTDEGGVMMEWICQHTDGSSCRLYEGLPYHEVRKWIAPKFDLPTFEIIGKQYETWYPGPKQRDTMSLRAASAFTTDWYERFPANQTASAWRDAGHKIYVYEFNVRPKGYSSLFMKVPWSEEAQHCDELPFLFAAVEDPEDMEISKKMIDFWSRFAEGAELPSWPRFGHKAEYVYISHEGVFSKQPLLEQKKRRFWRPWFSEGEFPADSEAWSNNAGQNCLSFAISTIFVLISLIYL